MNIYSYINSKDIKEHLESLDYQFNSLEASWLVYQSGRHTLYEKIDAWNWIIENMPDCEVKERMNCKYRTSLHETLKEYIELMNNFIKEFYDGDECVYTYGYYCIGDNKRYYDENVYKSIDDCFNDIFDGCDEEEKEAFVDIKITRHSISKEKRKVEVYFSKDKEILCVDAFSKTDDEALLTTEFFDGMWFAFPTPFKAGDVLIRYNENEYPPNRTEGGILVLSGCTPEWLKENNPKRLKSYIDGDNGDNSDMNVWGYFQDEDGRIYSETTFNYMDFEFYRGPYEGKERLMKAISSFMKAKIDLSMLLTAYRKVILDEFTKDVMLTHWFNDEALEFAGLSDLVKKN